MNVMGGNFREPGAGIYQAVSWLAVWMRAVIVPSVRRALPVWIGVGIVGGVIFGGTGMAPRDLTQLALRTPGVALGLGVVWLLLFVPVARLLVRDEATRFLRSLPFSVWAPRLIAATALVVLQVPWLVLWLVGEGGLGGAITIAFTPIIAVLARVRTKPPRGVPVWRGPITALLGIYVRALRRRASDALIRAAGLALLAGGAAGLFARNNALAPVDASVLAASVIAVVLVPGWAGALLPLVVAHGQARWLASSLGASDRMRVGVLGIAIGIVYVGAMVIAVVTAAIVVGDVATALVLVPIGVGTAIGLAMVVTRGVVWAGASETPAAKVVIASIVASAVAVLLLGWLGAPGVVALATFGWVTVPLEIRDSAELASVK